MSFTDDRTTADGIILISNPHYKDNVECSGCVIEKFRHNRLHSLKQPHTWACPSAVKHVRILAD